MSTWMFSRDLVEGKEGMRMEGGKKREWQRNTGMEGYVLGTVLLQRDTAETPSSLYCLGVGRKRHPTIRLGKRPLHYLSTFSAQSFYCRDVDSVNQLMYANFRATAYRVSSVAIEDGTREKCNDT